MVATCETVGLAEWIINDTCLIMWLFVAKTNSVRENLIIFE